MVDLGERMVAEWRPGERFDIHEEMMRVTLAIVAKALFNTDVTRDASDFNPLKVFRRRK